MDLLPTGKSVLSGDGWAHFEVCVHGGSLENRFRVQSLTREYDIEDKGKVKGNRLTLKVVSTLSYKGMHPCFLGRPMA